MNQNGYSFRKVFGFLVGVIVVAAVSALLTAGYLNSRAEAKEKQRISSAQVELKIAEGAANKNAEAQAAEAAKLLNYLRGKKVTFVARNAGNILIIDVPGDRGSYHIENGKTSFYIYQEGEGPDLVK